MIQCVLSPTLSFHSLFFFHAVLLLPQAFTYSRQSTHIQNTQPWKTQSAVQAWSLANELSYWNRKESALYCTKCCYGKPYRGGMEGKLLVRTKKHENVLSLQMYQFTFIRSRLRQFLPYSISFLPPFLPPSYHISLSLIKHHLVLPSTVRGKKIPI